jgi:hypothetical protein
MTVVQNRTRPRWPWIVAGLVLAAIVALGILFVVALGGTDAVFDGFKSKADTKDPVAGQMYTPVKDGAFELTVTRMNCDTVTVGDTTKLRAQGQYCLVDLTVKNTGTAPEIFPDIAQTGFDAGGEQYSADSTAGAHANKDHAAFLKQIAPGDTVQGTLVFDVPAGTELRSIVLHESLFTAGVQIPLKATS